MNIPSVHVSVSKASLQWKEPTKDTTYFSEKKKKIYIVSNKGEKKKEV